MYDAPLTVPAVLLALVLLVSGVAKLADLETAAQAFTSLRLPRFLVRWKIPTLLPIGEVVLAIALIVTSGWLAVVVDVAAVLLFVAYLVVIVRALGFGEPVTCSCFGKLGLGSVDRFTAVRNVILVALAALALADATRGHGVLERMRHFDGGEWAWTAGVLAAVVLTWLVAGHRGDAAPPAPAGASGAGLEDDDYLRVPIPFADVVTPAGTRVTLRDLASQEAVLLLLVSPTCGSCIDVIEHARTWQRTVPMLRTSLVLPMAPRSDVPGLADAGDFDLLFDEPYTVARLFGVGTPSAVLLGADGKLAGGPVSGTKDVVAFMGDIAEQLTADGAAESDQSAGAAAGGQSENARVDDAAAAPAQMPVASAVPADVVGDPAGKVSDGSPARAGTVDLVDGSVPADAGAVTAVDASTDSGSDAGDELLDYVPVPTPFAMFEDATGATTSLRRIGAAGPAIFLYVSPSCGSCLQVMDVAPAWQEQLGELPIHYVVTTKPQADVIVERGIDPARVLVDEPLAITQMMGVGTPTLFAVGPTQELIAGPVSGFDDISATMDDILVEVAAARPHSTGSADAAADGGAGGQAGSSDELVGPAQERRDATATTVPDVLLEDPAGRPVPATEAFSGRRVLIAFFSPHCEACHDVALRVDAWRRALPSWDVRVMVPGPASDFDAAAYAEGLHPDLFDVEFAFGEALGIETPALVMLDAKGRVLAEPARSQGECYALVRELVTREDDVERDQA